LVVLGVRALARLSQRRLQTVTANIFRARRQPPYVRGPRILEIFHCLYPLVLDVRIGVAGSASGELARSPASDRKGRAARAVG
jgi:hypothetical protein